MKPRPLPRGGARNMLELGKNIRARKMKKPTLTVVDQSKANTGYGDGVGTDLTAFISDDMRADWATNREELMAFWKSGAYTTADVFADSLPWLFMQGSADTLPRAAVHLD